MRNAFEFQDLGFTADPVLQYNAGHRNPDNCIVIDNGSHSCRAGWSMDSHPKLVFRNLLAKLRGKKEMESHNDYFGNDIDDLEDSKWNIRTQFDMNVVTHFDIQEKAFDYLFNHLGMNNQTSINHPICITEGVCLPNTLRHYMSEILFECYNVPKIAYGVDALFSLHHNIPGVQYGIIISCGYQATHVLPIVDGKFDARCSRRLNIGGLNMMIYSRRLLQLQYPNQAPVINLSRTQELLMDHCYMADDYFDELKKWQDPSFIEKHKLDIQLPVLNTATEKELELRKIQAMRLKDINQKKREEKLKVEEEQLSKFNTIRDLEKYNPAVFKQKLKEINITNETHLSNLIKDLEDKITDRKAKSTKYYAELYENKNSNIDIMDENSIEEIERMLNDLEEEKLTLLDKRRSKALTKQALNKRKSYASKERMRILSQLAKGNSNATVNKEDTFGMKDEDWDVYKFINKNGSDSEEEQDQEHLNEVEQLLSHYQLMLSKYMVGHGQKYQYLSFDTHKIRVPEVLYQPSMIGINQEGIAGMITYVLKNYDSETQDKMIKNIFVTGGPSKLPGFKERLEVELMALLPFQSIFKVYKASDCLYDAWKGAASVMRESVSSSDIFLDSKEYFEYGMGYLKEHKCSNEFVNLK